MWPRLGVNHSAVCPHQSDHSAGLPQAGRPDSCGGSLLQGWRPSSSTGAAGRVDPDLRVWEWPAAQRDVANFSPIPVFGRARPADTVVTDGGNGRDFGPAALGTTTGFDAPRANLCRLLDFSRSPLSLLMQEIIIATCRIIQESS